MYDLRLMDKEDRLTILHFLNKHDDEFSPSLRLQEFIDDYSLEERVDDYLERGYVVGAFHGRRPVGLALCRPARADEENAYLSIISVDKAYRGEGLGKQLLEKCLELLKGTGEKGVTLHTWSTAVAAKTLYEGLGFRETERGRGARGPGGDAVTYELAF